MVRTCAAAVAVLIVCAYPAAQVGAGTPSFDYSRAGALAPEKRREYDRVFFNEIELWDLNSNRYGTDSGVERRREFERMAADGHLISHVALRLAKDFRTGYPDDPRALEMLLKEARAGDASAMCAFTVIPMEIRGWTEQERINTGHEFLGAGAAKGHPGCMARRGTSLLFGTTRGIPRDEKAALPMLFESARQGYYVAARSLFWHLRNPPDGEFDYSRSEVLDRAMCWGRLAQQYSNWAFFDTFLARLRTYAREHDRPDLIEKSFRFDAQRVPITEEVVRADDCIALEQVGAAR